MSDQKLRELEHRWKESGSPDDEAAYLLERVRVGDLPRERLELAACCGHEGARRATCAAGPVRSLRGDFAGFVGSLRRWGRKALVEAAFLAATLVAGNWKSENSGEALDLLLGICAQWRSGGGAKTEAAAHSAEAGAWLRTWEGGTSAAWAFWAARFACRTVAASDYAPDDHDAEGEGGLPVFVDVECLNALTHAAMSIDALTGPMEDTGTERVLVHVSQRLAEWALVKPGEHAKPR